MRKYSKAECRDCDMKSEGAPDLVQIAVRVHIGNTGHRVDIDKNE